LEPPVFAPNARNPVESIHLFPISEQVVREKARSLYERLISLSGHHNVWILYAEFEHSSREDEDAEPRIVAGDPILARQVFERGYKDLGSKGLKAER
jgi:crooked neck